MHALTLELHARRNMPPNALMQRTALSVWVVDQYLARHTQLRAEPGLQDQATMLLDELRHLPLPLSRRSSSASNCAEHGSLTLAGAS